MLNRLEILGCPSHVAMSSRDVSSWNLSELDNGLSADQWAVVPLGQLGELLWSVPLSAARLVAPPTDYGVCLVPARDVTDKEDLWSRIVELPESAVIVLPARGNDANAPLLDLAPRGGRKVPSAVRSAFRQWALPAVASTEDVQALKAGILQLWDELDHSHEHSQSIEGEGRHVAGDYWHGIMHRREPDYGNSKYWFRRVGRHPVFEELAPLACEVLNASGAAEASTWSSRLASWSWDPMAMVDLCQHVARDQQSALGAAARKIQLIEMLLLLKSTWNDAVAG